MTFSQKRKKQQFKKDLSVAVSSVVGVTCAITLMIATPSSFVVGGFLSLGIAGWVVTLIANID